MPTAPDNTPTYTDGYQNASDVALDAAGDYIVAWNGYGSAKYGIYAQRFGFPQSTTSNAGSSATFNDGRGGTGFGCVMAPANDPNGHDPLLGLMGLLSGLFLWRRCRASRIGRKSG